MKRILSTVLTLSVMLVSCIMTTGCEKNGGNGNGNEGEYGFTKSDAILAFDSFISNFFESRGQFARDTNIAIITIMERTRTIVNSTSTSFVSIIILLSCGSQEMSKALDIFTIYHRVENVKSF